MLILILCRSGGAQRGNHAIEQRRVDGVFTFASMAFRVDGVWGAPPRRHTRAPQQKIHRRDAAARRATYKPWTSPAPDRTIDHAFCSPGAAFAGGSVATTDGYLSDHQPVVFEVAFNKT